jgi:hypothetical protein
MKSPAEEPPSGRAMSSATLLKDHMTTLSQSRVRATPRQPDRADASAAWHTHYFRGELIGSIRLSSLGLFEARDRMQQPLGLAFPTWDQAAAALEQRGRP